MRRFHKFAIEYRKANVPVISVGEVLATFGREVHLQGILHDAGGATNQVTLYYGLTDGGTVASDGITVCR